MPGRWPTHIWGALAGTQKTYDVLKSNSLSVASSEPHEHDAEVRSARGDHVSSRASPHTGV